MILQCSRKNLSEKYNQVSKRSYGDLYKEDGQKETVCLSAIGDLMKPIICNWKSLETNALQLEVSWNQCSAIGSFLKPIICNWKSLETNALQLKMRQWSSFWCVVSSEFFLLSFDYIFTWYQPVQCGLFIWSQMLFCTLVNMAIVKKDQQSEVFGNNYLSVPAFYKRIIFMDNNITECLKFDSISRRYGLWQKLHDPDVMKWGFCHKEQLEFQHLAK